MNDFDQDYDHQRDAILSGLDGDPRSTRTNVGLFVAAAILIVLAAAALVFVELQSSAKDPSCERYSSE